MTDKVDRGSWPGGWEVPPWELPGNFRLDCEPHRATLLRWLANVGLLGATFAYCPCACAPCLCLVWWAAAFEVLVLTALALGLLGAWLGLTALVLARRDLAGMQTGRIDPSGALETRFARERGLAALVWGVLAGLGWGAVLLREVLP